MDINDALSPFHIAPPQILSTGLLRYSGTAEQKTCSSPYREYVDIGIGLICRQLWRQRSVFSTPGIKMGGFLGWVCLIFGLLMCFSSKDQCFCGFQGLTLMTLRMWLEGCSDLAFLLGL